jgi:hypothetical protein
MTAVALGLCAQGAQADELQDRVLAGARAVRADSHLFRRTLAIERTGAPRQVRVEEHDPRRPPAQRWSLVSIDGRAPTAKELADARKQRRGPVPSYADIARWFGAPAQRVPAAPGYAAYRFARLPKGALKLGPFDASQHMTAEAVVNIQGPRPFVERVRWTAAKPFRMMLVASVRNMAITGEYRLLPNGYPVPKALSSDTAGSLLGRSGRLRTSATYADFRPVR